MKTQKMMVAALAAVALVGTTLTLSITSNAQGGGTVPAEQIPPPAQLGPPQGPGAPGAPAQAGPRFPGGGAGGFGQPGDAPAQFRQGGGFMGGGGGGNVAIDSDNSFLYIVQGNMIFKVSKADLRVMARGQLMEMPQGFPGGPGAAPAEGRLAPTRGGQRPPGGPGGGGGGATVRPPQEG